MARLVPLLLLALAVSSFVITEATVIRISTTPAKAAAEAPKAAAADKPKGKDCKEVCNDETKEVCGMEDVTKTKCTTTDHLKATKTKCTWECGSKNRRLQTNIKVSATSNCKQVCAEVPVVSVSTTKCVPYTVKEKVCKNVTETICKEECVEWEKPEVVAKPSLFPTLVAAAEDNKLSTFIAAIKAADLTSTVSDPETTWTVFAPTDAAFAAALKKLGTTADALLGNKELLTKILQFHVLPNAMDSDLLSIPDLQLTTLLGEGRDLVTKVDGKTITMDGEGSLAKVIKADQTAGKGVLHVIDAVLVPK